MSPFCTNTGSTPRDLWLKKKKKMTIDTMGMGGLFQKQASHTVPRRAPAEDPDNIK